METYLFKENETKTNLSQVLIEIYSMKDLHNVRHFCNRYGYKYIWCIHQNENENEKEHIHYLIKSDSHHRFVISSLLSDTLKYYNFMKCKTTMSAFCNYVMHKDYDYKKKYAFNELHFGNVNKNTIAHIRACLDCVDISTIDDEDVYNVNEFTKKLFSGQFTNFNQVIDFCNHTEILRKYFVLHSRQIYDTWSNFFSNVFYKDKIIVVDKKQLERKN